MGEMIIINCGESGLQIGNEYLDKLIYDHSLNELNINGPVNQCNNQNLSYSFNENKNGQLSLRGIFMDYNSQNIDKILTSHSLSYINPDLTYSSDRNNVSGTFHYGKNVFNDQFNDQFEVAVHRAIQNCDNLTSFHFPHSTYDKSCGLSIEALLTCYEAYNYKSICTYSIFPNEELANPIEIFNFGFSLQTLIENSFVVLVYDYKALERTSKSLNQETMSDATIAETMLQNTCSSRFPGFQNGDLSKLMTNLIPFPRLHFLTCAFSTLKPNKDLFEQINELSQPFNSYYTYREDSQNIYKTQAIIVRGDDHQLEIQQINKKSNNLCYWIGDGYFHVNCKIKHRFLGETILHIGNQANFGMNIKYCSEQFNKQLSRKAFLHYYYSEGCDEMEFIQAESNLGDIISEYCQCTQGVFSDEEEGYDNE